MAPTPQHNIPQRQKGNKIVRTKTDWFSKQLINSWLRPLFPGHRAGKGLFLRRTKLIFSAIIHDYGFCSLCHVNNINALAFLKIRLVGIRIYPPFFLKMSTWQLYNHSPNFLFFPMHGSIYPKTKIQVISLIINQSKRI